jgi:hypothetical protein
MTEATNCTGGDPVQGQLVMAADVVSLVPT